jgi:hypothetical protein
LASKGFGEDALRRSWQAIQRCPLLLSATAGLGMFIWQLRVISRHSLATFADLPTAGIRSATLVGIKPTFNALYSTLPFIELRSGVANTGDIEIAPTGAGSTTPEKGTSHG